MFYAKVVLVNYGGHWKLATNWWKIEIVSENETKDVSVDDSL